MKGKSTQKAVQQKPVAEKPIARGFKPDWRLALICAIAAFALYANTIPNQYAMDDIMIITKNQFIAQGFKGIPQLFSIDVWHFGNANLGYYRPLSLVTFAIENQFFHSNPHVAHLGNVMLYAITAFFVCWLLMVVFKNYHPAFSLLVTLLFIAHPIHTEVVANIKSRDEILSFLNIVIAGCALLYALQQNRKWLLPVAYLFFYLALLSKETALIGIVLLPGILLFTGNKVKQVAIYTAPLFLLLFVFQLQKYYALGSLTGSLTTEPVNYPYAYFNARIPSVFMIFMWCVKLVLLPYPLSYNYAYNQLPPAQFTSPETIIGIVLALALVYGLVVNAKKKTAFSAGLWLWSIALAPALGFVLLKGGILAERILYAPALGFSIIAVVLLAKAANVDFSAPQFNFKILAAKPAFIAPAVLVILLYSAETFARNPVWYNNYTLCKHDVEVASQSCQVHDHYGNILVDSAKAQKDTLAKQKYFAQAVEQFRQSINISNYNPESYFGIALAYQSMSLFPDSVIYYCNLSAQQSPVYHKAFGLLAVVYENLGKQRLASFYYNKALELNPFDAEAVNNHLQHMKNTGLDVKAITPEELTEANASADKDREYAKNRDLGREYGMKGDYQNALIYLTKALDLNPNSPEALVNLAICYGMMNNYDKNIEILNRMLALYPNSVIALQNMVTTYKRTGNHAKADEYQKRLDALNGK